VLRKFFLVWLFGVWGAGAAWWQPIFRLHDREKLVSAGGSNPGNKEEGGMIGGMAIACVRNAWVFVGKKYLQA
jgi:hypothetical protein